MVWTQRKQDSLTVILPDAHTHPVSAGAAGSYNYRFGPHCQRWPDDDCGFCKFGLIRDGAAQNSPRGLFVPVGHPMGFPPGKLDCEMPLAKRLLSLFLPSGFTSGPCRGSESCGSRTRQFHVRTIPALESAGRWQLCGTYVQVVSTLRRDSQPGRCRFHEPAARCR